MLVGLPVLLVFDLESPPTEETWLGLDIEVDGADEAEAAGMALATAKPVPCDVVEVGADFEVEVAAATLDTP